MLALNIHILKSDYSSVAGTTCWPYQFEDSKMSMEDIVAIMNEVDSRSLKYFASFIAMGGIPQPGTAVMPVFKNLEQARSVIGLACFGITPYVISTLNLGTIEEIFKDLKNGLLTDSIKATIEKSQTDTGSFVLNFADDIIKPSFFKLVVKFLERNGSLKKLSLNGSALNISEIQALTDALKNNKSLIELNFFYANMRDKGAELFADALRRNTSLTRLSLWNCRIEDVGAKALADALKTNPSLVMLDLWRNHIGDEGALALIDALKVNDSLFLFKIEDNPISDTVLKDFQKVTASKDHLTVIPCSLPRVYSIGSVAQ